MALWGFTGFAGSKQPWRLYRIECSITEVENHNSILINCDPEFAHAFATPEIGVFMILLHEEEASIRTLWLTDKCCKMPTRTTTALNFEGVGSLDFENPDIFYTSRYNNTSRISLGLMVNHHLLAYSDANFREGLQDMFPRNRRRDFKVYVKSITELTCMRCQKENCGRKRRIERQSIAVRIEKQPRGNVESAFRSDMYVICIFRLAVVRVTLRNSAERCDVAMEVQYWAHGVPYTVENKQKVLRHVQSHFNHNTNKEINWRTMRVSNVTVKRNINYRVVTRAKTVRI